MPEFQYRSEMPASAAEVYAWHVRPGALERLLPPWMDARVIRREGGVEDGGTVLMELAFGPWRGTWLARHEDPVVGRQFVDEQVEGPFAKWRHTHRFMPIDAERSAIEDHVHFRSPAGGLGHRLGTPIVQAELAKLFPWRHARTRLDLRRHKAAGLAPMRIVVSGASGLVGQALCAFLSTGGHRVDRLVRRPPAPGTTDIQWDPTSGAIDLAALEGADAVIHLSGENLAQKWTPAAMNAIMGSRKVTTRLLAEAIARLEARPKVFISASGVGYYGDRGDDPVDEDDRAAGTGFLAEVCQAWELATTPAREAGVRTVNLRLGVVVTPRGGALAKMLPPFRLGLGGPIGSGAQWMSWIGLDDALGAFLHVLKSPSLEGPVNATSPQPVTNKEFTRMLGQAIRRPTPFPLPAGAVLALFGDMGKATLLEGQRVVPARLLESGFRFETPYLAEALRWELGQPEAIAAAG
jgi:uncharacterized protein (TIGR01777 family)